MREAYGRAPRDLRRDEGAVRGPRDAEIELRLSYRPPLDWPRLLRYLAARAIPGVEEVQDDRYRRSVVVAGVRAWLELRADPRGNAVRLRVPASLSPSLPVLVEAARRICDLGADPAQITAALQRDQSLRPVLRNRPGLRVPGAWDGFELAVRVVLGQQVSVAGATTLSGRLVERWGETLREPRGGLTHVFPTAERLARVDWSGIGIPRARARALHTLAREVAAGRLSLTSAADAERTTSALLAIPGIGPWTSQVVAMRALREPDAFPAGDLGLRKALANGGRPLSPREVEARSEAWRPWRAYAAMALWAGLSDSEER